MADKDEWSGEEENSLLQEHESNDSCIENEGYISLMNEVFHLAITAAPQTFTLLMDILPSIINLALVGHLNTTQVQEDMNVVALSSMYINVTAMAAILGLAKGLDALCTQSFLSSGNFAKFGIYLQSSLLGMLLAFLPVIVLNIFGEQVLVFLNQDPTLSAKAGLFIQFSAIGLPFVALFEFLRKPLLVQDITNPAMYISLISNVLHIILGYFFIRIPSLGYCGAAIARSVASVCLPLLLLPYFVWRRDVYRAWAFHWNWDDAVGHLRQFFHFGVPDMLSLMIEYGIFELLILLSGLMTDYSIVLATNAVLINLFAIINMLCLGISMATTTRIGSLLSKYRPRQARTAALGAFALTSLFALASVLALSLGSRLLPEIFTGDVAITERASKAMVVVIPMYLVCGAASIIQGVLWAVDKQDIANYVNAGGYYIVGIPLAAVFGFNLNWGIEGLWLGLSIGASLNVLVYLWFLFGLNWKQAAKDASNRAIEHRAIHEYVF